MSNMTVGRFVGQSVLRKEDPRLVSGHGTYVDDIVLPRMVHAAFLRSDVARANIVRIDTSAAETAPGVIAVYTGSDLQAKVAGTLQATMALAAPLPPLTPLAVDRVVMAGEAVALVVADSRYRAEDACELIEVDYDVLTPVIDLVAAADDTVNLVHPERGSNVIVTNGVEPPGLADAFANAAHVITETFEQFRQSQVPMEPHGIVATWDSYEGNLKIWASSQRIHEVRATASRATGVPEHRIHALQKDVGGGFGQKGAMRPEEVAVVMAAMDLERPVKWAEDRRENLVSGGHCRRDCVTVKMALDRDHRIIGVHLDHLEDAGANPTGGSIGGLVAMMFPGPYRMGTLGWRTRYVLTNTGGRSAYRGPWNLETVAREQMMDRVARELGLDPVEFRRLNAITGADMPFKNASGMTYDNVDPVKCLDQALDMLGHDSFRAEQAAARAEGRRLGVGISLVVEPTALGAGSLIGTEAAHVKVNLGGKVTIALGTSSHGQSVQTTMAQIVADELGVHFDDVTVIEGDSESTPIGGGNGGSRAGVIGGAAAHKASAQLREKIVNIAADMLEAAPGDLEINGGRVSVKGTPTKGVTFSEIAILAHSQTMRLPKGMEAGLEALVRYSTPGITWATACHICVIEIDATGEMHVRRFIVSEDCGVMINPMIVDGQISGGVVQGIGAVLHEQFQYDEAGNPLTTTFMDYLIPTTTEIPILEIGHLETPAPGPGGYKGVGEGGAIGAVPAVRNAISDALGVDITTPVRPCDVLELIDVR